MIRNFLVLPFLPALVFGMGASECSGSGPAGSCMIGGVVYEDGDRGIPAGDGCNTCSCEDGALSCTEIGCPMPGSCELGGTVYPDGTTGIPDLDGCNTCTCVSGSLACTDRACPPGGACEVDGVSFPDGSTGVPAGDGCNTCVCDDGALTSCTEEDCSEMCSIFGTAYFGSAPATDGCNSCTCIDGVIGAGCTDRACGPIPIEVCPESNEFTSDAYDLGPISIEGDTLSVQVSYSGGCAPHYFRLCYEPGFLESDPVQANIRLDHDGQGDTCEAYPTEVRQFDLRPLADAWRTAYAMEHGTVIMRIGEYPSYDF